MRDPALGEGGTTAAARLYLTRVKRRLLSRGYLGGPSAGNPDTICGQCRLPVPNGHILLAKRSKREDGKMDRWCFECIEDHFLTVEEREQAPAELDPYRATGEESL